MQNAGATSSRAGAGPVLAVLGAALVVVSKFLEFGKITGQGASATVKGSNGILIAGIALAVVGILMWVAKTPAMDRLLGILAILVGAFGVLVSVALLGKDAIISSVASSDSQEQTIKGLVKAGQLTVKIGVAPYLALGGSILVIVAGIANLVTAKKEKQDAPPVPAAPPAMTT